MLDRATILNELEDHIHDPESTDNSAIQALRVIKKYDRKRALTLALEMHSSQTRFVPVRELLLQMLEEDNKDIPLEQNLLEEDK